MKKIMAISDEAKTSKHVLGQQIKEIKEELSVKMQKVEEKIEENQKAEF